MKSFLRASAAFFLIAQTFNSFAQMLPKSDAEIITSLEQNLSYLADDRMEGRLTGSRGEKLAYEFIIQNFQSLNLLPKGSSNFLQPFSIHKLGFSAVDFYAKKSGTELALSSVNPSAWFPLAASGVGKIKAKSVWLGNGLNMIEAGYDDYANKKNLKGKVFVIRYGVPEFLADKPDLKPYASLDEKIRVAVEKGAAGIVFINQNNDYLEPDFKSFIKSPKNNIPIYFIGAERKVDTSLFDNGSIKISVDTATIEITGHNVVGYINNKAANTIVFGAHYDHLGYNELGGSTYRKTKNEKPQIYNGADDNASGTVALIELAEIIGKSPYRNNNYLFIAFSGEEEGLLGSNYYCKNLTIDGAKVNYMINMDMVGRLDTAKKSFSVSGTGTSPKWNEVLPSVSVKGLSVKYTESGTGSSDHTSFYNIGIPVLHYFTGSHGDYHKPSDDDNLINYQGELDVIKHIYMLIGKLDKEPKLAFTQTKADTSEKVSFKVTMGIMPDYLFDGKGVKIDGVTDGRPAAIAGVKRGDLLLQLGEYKTESMEDYMKCLQRLDKGQTVKAKIIRSGQEIELEVKF